MRHRLRPGLYSVWRGRGTLQLGLGTRASLVLSGVTDADIAFLDLLVVGVADAAVRDGAVPPGPSRCAQLLEHLSRAQLLITRAADPRTVAAGRDARDRLHADAVAWSMVCDGEREAVTDGWDVVGPRTRRTVQVRGLGRTGWAVAATLAAAGVTVTTDDSRPVRASDLGPCGPGPGDLGLPRDEVFDRTHETVPGAGIGPEPDLVVQIDHAAADAGAAAALVSRDIAHLSVVVGEARTVVGPFVLPGRTSCLRCLDLHRCERDPAWATVSAQLTSHHLGIRCAVESISPEEPEETTIALACAALAAAQVLTHFAGGIPQTVGSTLELSLPDLLPSRRTWSRHPACGCAEVGGGITATGSSEPVVAVRGTMLE